MRLELVVWKDERGLSSVDFGAMSCGNSEVLLPLCKAIIWHELVAF